MRAAAARYDLEAFNLVPDVLVVGGVGQEDQPVRAGVGVVVLAGFPWTEYARLFGVHSGVLSLWAGLRGVPSTCGAISCVYALHFTIIYLVLQQIQSIILSMSYIGRLVCR
jgi:hypothetical protein